jgi:GNAT superfamily N-acetyltransferase
VKEERTLISMDGKSTSLHKYTIQQEEFTLEFYEEVYPLFEEHWEEVAADKDEIALNPNWDTYLTLQQNGSLLVVTCRETNTNILVGYCFSLMFLHLHYQDTLCAENDLIFISPEHRKGLLGVKLIRESEKLLKEAGCKAVQMRVKFVKDFGKIVERLGYYPSETLYHKYIGEV